MVMRPREVAPRPRYCDMVMASGRGLGRFFFFWKQTKKKLKKGGGTRTAVGGVKGTLDAGGPLQLADDAVGALDFLPEPGMVSAKNLGEWLGRPAYIGPILGAAWARIPLRLPVMVSAYLCLFF